MDRMGSIKQTGRVFVLIASMLLFAACMAMPKNAWAVDSDWASATVGGRKYLYRSGALAGTWGVSASTDCTASEYLPAGYVGVLPRLYNSAGVLVGSGSWSYSPDGVGGIGRSTANYDRRGTFYGKGQVRIYNGNGYNTYTTYSSPYVQRAAIPQVRISEQGDVYGSGLFYDESSLDYILAMGVSGSVGYVKFGDLENDSVPGDPLEALAKTDGINTVEIPLYDEDGITVIDVFRIENGQTRYY